MGNRRSPRRLRLGSAYLLAAVLAAAGCQRPLVQQVEPLTVTSNVRKERPDTVRVPHPFPLLETEVPPSPEDIAPPARAAALPPAVPTPLLDSIAAQATKSGKVSLASLDATKPESSAPAEAPATDEDPSRAVSSAPPPAAAPAVVEVPSTEAPPVAGPETKIVITPPVHKEPEKKPEPAELWRDGLEQLRNLARDQAGKNDDAAGDWSLRFALLDWLGRDGGKPSDTRWRTVLIPLAHLTDGSLAAEPALAAELRAAVTALEECAPLEITAVQLCRKVSGFGDYVPIDNSGCKAGRSVIVYCEMSGVRYEQEGELFHSRVSSRAELRAAGEEKAVWTHEQEVAHDSSHHRRRDYYVNYRLDLPEDLPPGKYELVLSQTDLTTQQTATRTTALTVSR